jgi:polar amino acid transport system substrate-binding protein
MVRLLVLFLLLIGQVSSTWSQEKMVVATDSWPPFRISAGGDHFVGLDIDILQELSQRTGIVFEIRRYPWSRALMEMQNGSVDLMTGLAFSKERAQFIDYLSPSYYACHPAFYGLFGVADTVKSYADLGRWSIGFVRGSRYFDSFDDDQKLHKKRFVTEEQLMNVALLGRVDLFIGTDCQVDHDLKRRGLSNQLKKSPFRPDHTIKLFIGISQRSTKLLLKRQIEQTLQKMLDDGTVRRLSSAYLEPSD